jgi:hypothetical protein
MTEIEQAKLNLENAHRLVVQAEERATNFCYSPLNQQKGLAPMMASAVSRISKAREQLAIAQREWRRLTWSEDGRRLIGDID